MEPFRPPAYLAGGHTQTLAGAFLRRPAEPPWERLSVASAHGDRLTIDRLTPRGDVQRRLLLLHGITGCSRASPLPQIAILARAGGVDTWALNFRGADARCPAIPRLYHAGCSDDLEAVFRQLPQDKPWSLVGFSLGANVMLKWLGQDRPELPQGSRALAVSCPYDLAESSANLEKNFLARRYRSYLIARLKRKVRSLAANYPGVVCPRALNTSRTFFDIDDGIIAPLHGFKGAWDYWARCSSSRFLESIRVPTTLLHAADDPFQPAPPRWVRTPHLSWEVTETAAMWDFSPVCAAATGCCKGRLPS